MRNIHVFLAIGGFVGSMYAQDAVQCHNCPEEMRTAVEKFWAIPANRTLVAQLTTLKHPLSEVPARHAENGAQLEAAGYKNLTDNNYVFVLDQGTCVGVVASPGNRRWNLLYRAEPTVNHHRRVEVDGQPILAEQWDGLEIVPTFQTVSRVKTFATARDFIASHGITAVYIPDTYAVQFEAGDLLHDGNSFVIQRFIPGELKRIAECPDILARVTIDQIDQLLAVIMAIGHWNRDILFNVIAENPQQFIIVDLEQPNNSNPDMYPDLDVKKNQWNTIEGITALYKSCAAVPALQDRIRTVVDTNDTIRAFTRYSDLRKKVDLE